MKWRGVNERVGGRDCVSLKDQVSSGQGSGFWELGTWILSPLWAVWRAPVGWRNLALSKCVTSQAQAVPVRCQDNKHGSVRAFNPGT